MNPFEQLIRDLSRLLGIPLHSEKGYICKLLIQGSLKVQLEHESAERRILMASFPAELPPGKFREDLLKEALKANNSLDRLGSLAYSEKNNSLAFFLYLPDDTTSDKVFEVLSQFIEIAKTWKMAAETGQIHLIAQQTSARLPSPFM